MTGIRRVTVGQPVASALKASTWNAFVDTANHVLFDKQPRGRDSGRKWYDHTQVVTVHNTTGADRKAGDILAINGIATTPTVNLEAFRTHPAFTAVTPALAYHGQFVIAAEGIKNTNRGLAIIAGIVPVQINVATATQLFKRADLTTTSDYLVLAPHGSAQVLYIESGTGTKWALIRMGCHETVSETGKTNATITPGNAGDVHIYRAGVDTGYSVSAYVNWMDAEQVSINKEVIVQWFTGERIWRIVGAECE